MRLILFVATVLILPGLLPAQPVISTGPLPSPPIYPGASIPDLQKYLSLTDAQVSSLSAILQQEQQAVAQLSSQLNQKQQDLQTQLQATSPNALSIGQDMIDIQNLEKQMAQFGTASYQTQALAVLNHNQLTLLANLNTALQLQTTAYEAVSVFLIAAPASSPVLILTPPGVAASGPAAALQPAGFVSPTLQQGQ